MMTISADHLIGERPAMDGVQRRYQFPNGYGASVVRHTYSHGGPEGFWELGVLGPDGKLDYETPITDDVLGWLSVFELNIHLAAVAALPAKVTA